MSRAPTKSELAIDLARSHVILFRSTESDDSYGAIQLDGHQETWPLKSRGFREWLQAAFFVAHSRPLGGQALKDALDTLSAQARFEGEERRVHVRVARFDDCIVLDRGDSLWRTITVSTRSAEVGQSPDLHFARTPTIQPFGSFDLAGSIDELRPFVNVEHERDFMLVVGWMVAALAGRPPFPILVIHGEQGSGKSTLAAMLRSLVDPSSYRLRSTPREERDLVAAARNNWALVFDNLSHVPEWLSDALCRVATGGGLGGRRLYTDDEEHVFDGTRPVILNGIPDLVYRPDLMSRCLIVRLRSLDGQRGTEAELWRRFEAARPCIFGALLRGLQAAIRNLDSVTVSHLPRLADFVTTMTAAEEGLGWSAGSFADALDAASAAARVDELADDPVFAALSRLLDEGPRWSGTAAGLLQAMGPFVPQMVARSPAWPATPTMLGNRLRRMQPFLRGVGVLVEFDRSSEQRTVHVRRIERDKVGDGAS